MKRRENDEEHQWMKLSNQWDREDEERVEEWRAYCACQIIYIIKHIAVTNIVTTGQSESDFASAHSGNNLGHNIVE